MCRLPNHILRNFLYRKRIVHSQGSCRRHMWYIRLQMHMRYSLHLNNLHLAACQHMFFCRRFELEARYIHIQFGRWPTQHSRHIVHRQAHQRYYTYIYHIDLGMQYSPYPSCKCIHHGNCSLLHRKTHRLVYARLRK